MHSVFESQLVYQIRLKIMKSGFQGIEEQLTRFNFIKTQGFPTGKEKF